MSDSRDDSVLDPSVIQSLRELGGDAEPGLLGELVQLFLQDSPDKLRALQEGFGGRDAKVVERNAHSLKSSAASLGANSLSKLLAEIEAAGRAHDLERVASLLPRTSKAYDQARDALRRLVQG
jgi:histidine phosphotransfer protein HptB